MARYASTNACREVFLRHYFGETECKPCGNCDNCKSEISKQSLVNRKDIQKISKALESGEKTFDEISKNVGWDHKKTKQVLSFMVRENYVESDQSEDLYSLSRKT